MTQMRVNEPYEIYQIITDFGDPLEIFREAFQNSFDASPSCVVCHVWENRKLSGDELIIDVKDDGEGLQKSAVAHFFDLANSNKVDSAFQPLKGKIGYKGHGSKIFFNAEEIIVTSRTESEEWSVSLKSPIEQIERTGKIVYSDFKEPPETGVELPSEWDHGFFVRIIGHRHFRTQYTKHKLSQLSVRDYARWFSVFGSVHTLTNGTGNTQFPVLLLRGLNWDDFETKYVNSTIIDPQVRTKDFAGVKYEKISFGHYLPPERKNESQMKTYALGIDSSRPYYEYYSRTIYNDQISCPDGTTFRLLVHLEGYETKRRYDPLLTGRGRSRTEISHSDSQRYGIWACKGGVPVERIDHWLGGKGGYSFMHAFVDCDEFDLTANRGSIHNTDIEKLNLIKQELNRIFSTTQVLEAVAERTEIEKLEQQILSIDADGKNLKKRFRAAQHRDRIQLPNGGTLLVPSKLSAGNFSESETMVLLAQLIAHYPSFFDFNFLDYNTSDGIDFVVEHQNAPKYVELKGTMKKYINHPFRHIHKFVCYECGLLANDTASDIEDFVANMKINATDTFSSFDPNFRGKPYKSFNLVPSTAAVTSMEVLELKSLLSSVVGATFL